MSELEALAEECAEFRAIVVLLLRDLGTSERSWSREQVEAAELEPCEIGWDEDGLGVRLAGGR